MSYEPTGLGAHEMRILWPDPSEGPWLLVFWFIELNHRSECVGFEMRSFVKNEEHDQRAIAPGGPRPLTASLHRSVAFDSEAQRARKEGAPFVPYSALRWMGIDPDKVAETGWGRAEARATGSAPTGRPPGRPTVYTADHFAEVAAIYAEADRNNLPATKVVQDYFAEKWDEEVTRSQAAKWVHRARHEFGLLGQTEPRRQGGGLGQPAEPHEREDER